MINFQKKTSLARIVITTNCGKPGKMCFQNVFILLILRFSLLNGDIICVNTQEMHYFQSYEEKCSINYTYLGEFINKIRITQQANNYCQLILRLLLSIKSITSFIYNIFLIVAELNKYNSLSTGVQTQIIRH